MPLPGSMFALDIEGGTVEDTGLGFSDGDADRPCMPIPGTLVPVPWQTGRIAQVQLRMFDHDGTRFFGDPRWVLEDAPRALHARSASRPSSRSNTSSISSMPSACRSRTAATPAEVRSPAGVNTARRSTR